VNEKCLNAFNFRLTETLVIFGIDNNIKIDSVCAFILLFAKQYLYKCKLDSNAPDIDVFIVKLRNRYKIEEYNARIELRYNDFAARWQPYRLFMDFDN